MNTKQTVVVAAAVLAVPYIVQAVSSRIPIRRKNVVAESDQKIATCYNRLTRQWEEVRNAALYTPEMQRVDAIIREFEDRQK